MFEKNMGTIDRAARTGFALVVAALYFTGTISGTLGLVLGVLAVVFLATSFLGTCPLYTPFGIKTRAD